MLSFISFLPSMLVHHSSFLNILIFFCKLFTFFHGFTCFNHHICTFCKCSTCKVILHHTKLVSDIIVLLFLVVCCVIYFFGIILVSCLLILVVYCVIFCVQVFSPWQTCNNFFFIIFGCCFEVFF
jgi:hypothetical protein